MPVNSVLICRVSGLTFTPTNGELYLRATCTGYPESKRIEFEAIEMSSSLSRIYKARYSAPAGTKWSGWKQSLTNDDIEPSQQSVTKTLSSGTSNITMGGGVANKDENIMISVYAGFAQNYTGVRTLCIYKGGTPIVADKGPATDGEGLHQSSVCANIHLNAGESINIAAQQNSGASLSVNFVINSTRKVTFK